MKKMNYLIIILIIAIIVIGALVLTTFMNQGQQATAAGEQSTKIAFYNNGTTWVSVDFILENMTLKNGSMQTIYSEEYLKPNSSVIVDISKLAGYDNESLPAGTTIAFLAWFGLNNANSTGDLNSSMEGWSKTLQPPAGNQIVNVSDNGLPNDGSLNLTDNAVYTDTELNALVQKVGFEDSINANEPLFVQGTITVNQDGTVTIVLSQTPVLCESMAHIIP